MIEFPLLSTKQVGGIVNFRGYGLTSAPVWFIGFEEGLGKMDPQDAFENLESRANFKKTMDLYEAHRRLKEKGQQIDIEKNTPSTPVWRYMAKIVLAYNGKEWSDRETAKDYVRYRLGRSNGETFLTELSPIPKGKAADEKKWMAYFRKCDPELDAKIKQRREELKQALKENSNCLVICYGMGRKAEFEELLGIKFSPTDSSNSKVHKSEDARYLLLPFFGRGMSHSVIKYALDSGLLRKSR